MNSEVKKGRGGARPNTGGARPNAGRKPLFPKMSPDEIAVELVFPALCTAFKSEPDKWGGRQLEVELSKTDIFRAYGKDGLTIWVKYFKLEKIGGRDRFGVGYKSRWTLHLGHYAIAKMLVETLGHSLKELPEVGFPPIALQRRLEKIEVLRKERQLKKDNKSTLCPTTK